MFSSENKLKAQTLDWLEIKFIIKTDQSNKFDQSLYRRNTFS